LKDSRKKTHETFKKCDERHAEIFHNSPVMGWSPENMSAPMRLETPKISFSHSTIYRRIREDKANGLLHDPSSQLPALVDISQRPKLVKQRLRLGDWEGDTVYGQDASLVTLVERKSLLTLIGKVSNKTIALYPYTL
jgi:transposase, IS30 family